MNQKNATMPVAQSGGRRFRNDVIFVAALLAMCEEQEIPCVDIHGAMENEAGVLPEDYDFEAHQELVPMQPGDVPVTYADTDPLERDFGFRPNTELREGLRRFARWYKKFYEV